MNSFIYILFVFSRCQVTYPWYISNTGKEYGIVGEDIKLLPVWNDGYSGKNVKIRFITSGCNPDHEALKENFISKYSFNFETNVSDVSFVDITGIEYGTELVSIACGKNTGNGFTGIAPNASFSISVLSQTYESIQRLLEDYQYFGDYDDIIVDTTTFSFFPSLMKFYLKRRVSEVEEMLQSYIKNGRNGKGKVLLVSSEGTNYTRKKTSLFENYPEAFLISQSDYIGAEGPMPQFSAATLVNAPSYGNADVKAPQRDYPPIPVAKSTSLYKGRDAFPASTQLSIVAGVIALMLEQHPNLTQRDILWILALSSSQNDPFHPSWKLNGRMLMYSTCYGFGRVNATEAMRYANLWSEDMLQKLRRVDIKHQELPQTIPHARTGQLELNFTLTPEKLGETENYLGCVENVIFNFNTSNVDISVLRIMIQSPSGTKIEILKPDPSFNSGFPYEHYVKENFQLLARGFLGETLVGTWTVTIIDSSFYQNVTLNDVSLIIDYMDDIPHYPRRSPTTTSASQYPLESNNGLEITLNENSSICGEELTGTVKTDGFDENDVSFFLVDRNSIKTFPVNATVSNGTYTSVLPCMFNGNKTFYFAAQNRAKNAFAYKNLTVINSDTKGGIVAPQPYSDIVSDYSETATFNITLHGTRDTLPLNGLGSYYILSVYDLDNNIKTLEVTLDAIPHDKLITVSAEFKKPQKAIVTIVPVDQENPDPCNTFVIPLSYRNKKDESLGQFTVPLNNFCAIPDGVIPDNTPQTTPQPKAFFATAGGISLIISICVIVILLIGVILFFVRERRLKVANMHKLEDQMLL